MLMFQSLPGNLGVPAQTSDATPIEAYGEFQSLPGNLGVPADLFISKAVLMIDVSIPSREFGSSGTPVHTDKIKTVWGFNPFQGIWEFRLTTRPAWMNQKLVFQSLPGNLGVPALLSCFRN